MEFKKIPGNEFSRLLPREQLDQLPFSAEISASGEERAALAKRFNLLDLSALSARLSLAEGAERGVFLAEGVLDASVRQSCVVTLEPVEHHLQETFEVALAEAAEVEKMLAEQLQKGSEDEDLPEVLPPEGLDLGELVAQQLSLALDPYPRAAGADDALKDLTAAQNEEAKPGPFDVLRGLQGKD